jgi:hypothetical protein
MKDGICYNVKRFVNNMGILELKSIFRSTEKSRLHWHAFAYRHEILFSFGSANELVLVNVCSDI